MIFCVGEILADMIASQTSQGITYLRRAGGAPFNVACNMSKLGCKVGFCGSVGKDDMGDYLVNFAKNNALDCRYLHQIDSANTTLAFVDLKDGERSFWFMRGADAHLDCNAIDGIVQCADIIHLGSLPLSEQCGRDFFDQLIAAAKLRNIKIALDVNMRADIFDDMQTAINTYARYAKMADILKLSEEEALILSGKNNAVDATKCLAIHGKIVFVTLGSKGSLCCHNSTLLHANALQVTPIDTTGAGDAYFAGALSVLHSKGLDHLQDAMRMGSVCGGLTTLQLGAIDAFPDSESISASLSKIHITTLTA